MNEILRQAIRAAHRRDESQCVAALCDEVRALPRDAGQVADLARQLVEAVRRQRRHASGVDHLMHEFSLSSQEGVALMCLAEALLRIPDALTVDRLIRDKISRGDWAAHLGGSPSLFVNAATWGLLLTGKLVATHSENALAGALGRLIARGGEPLIRKGVDFAMRLLGQQFVMGEQIEAALQRSAANEARGYGHSFDMLGEAALTEADARRYADAYAQAIHAIGRASGGRGPVAGPGISIKLSALHPRYQRSQRERVSSELLARLKALLLLAKGYDIGVNIDAEEADRLELSFDLLEALAGDPELAGWHGLGFVVQAYQKRCPALIDALIDLARRSRRRLMIRLVKGAYWDSEIKRAQVDGLADYPVYTRKTHSDLAYLACAGRLLAAPDAIYPQFATHNAHTLASIYQMAGARGVRDYEFQCLHGMGEPLYDNVVGADKLARLCRIYAPVGTHETLLPYLVRRLLENGANSSFVNRIVDDAVSIDELVEDPLLAVAREGGTRHPAIPLPPALYGGERVNSAGVDLADETTLAELARSFAAGAGKRWQAVPLVGGHAVVGQPGLAVSNPAARGEIVGSVVEATVADVATAAAIAEQASAGWHATAPAQRAAILLRAGDLLEARRDEILALCIREAGKTWPNAVAELREAVDFCRYYGQQLKTGNFRESATPPGPVACISPWNFPLAIFVGEVSAALAAGSPVLAKPAEQTPLIAALAVEVLHQAGVPGEVLQFLPGRGDVVGAALTADARVRGVVFTGSTEVARLINRNLAPRPCVRLIAETGGQNAMIVDSSALPEQVVQDVLQSAFDSAGQRCSALRVLCLQQDIAGRVSEMLKAAMAELVIGNPAALATDVGPVIDEAARAALCAHIETMRRRGRPVHQLPLPEACAGGCFVPPTLIEIESLADLEAEVFGPVVHLLRFDGRQLPALVEAINATGYGLTLGIHSRIDESIDAIVAAARVGNIYVNRNMVGAVVGVQPFGGEGLSGTGPKAGGPLYLPRLAETPVLSALDLGAPPPPLAGALAALAEWAVAVGDDFIARRCREAAADSLLGVSLALPGPTGESNRLWFAPRGRLLCVAAGETGLLAQLAAVLATGNRAALVDGDPARALLARLPEALRQAIELRGEGDFAGLAGVLVERGGAATLAPRLAAGDGPLLPLLVETAEAGRYPLYRLLCERVLSINTTAAGGNTTLMTLGA
ncbi:bifunctional proline dehydrogenase/L-glutamate gamma-semialdehyde dehydrogenase PutA [Azonexus fungiphilus]|uniref:bifunctional proline dehydrogenase/L-glutamate gamma-semialdehyde dehydrogenase PutA n=1 Tax=Azonexus fungiphilus TaxID=146940 RepID=UPI00156BD5B8|nr:bifunctional proline dehydrogenase/L-glutamate gamma-semialdehyde dehydrogenase PutA [Azonexus fungiphilus]NHC06374.1 bifunctional proline dehydrogenase/L-glutamate gamma-semialdehyde dehydrogenase PutA [Azonexus fungiphilus]